MKKIIVLAFLISGILGCFCRGIPEFWNATGFTIQVQDKMGADMDATYRTISGDSVGLLIQFDMEFVEVSPVQELMAPFLISSAYAFQCPDPGDRGMQDGIKDIQVTSSMPFNEMAPGTSLNGLMSARYEWSFWEDEHKALADWVASFSPRPASESDILLTFAEQPASGSIHQIKIEITLNSGKRIVQETPFFRWD